MMQTRHFLPRAVILWAMIVGVSVFSAAAMAQDAAAEAPAGDAAAGADAEAAAPEKAPEKPSPFAIIPIETQVAVIVPDMLAFSDSLATLNGKAELEVEWMQDALGEFTRATSMRQGVDQEGAFIIAITNLQSVGTIPEPPVVMIVKVEDFDRFIENFDGQVNADIAEFYLSAGQRVFAKHVDGHAVMSAQLALIENYLPARDRGKAKFAGMIGTVGEDLLRRSHVALVVDLQQSAPRIKQAVEEYLTKQKPIATKAMKTDATRTLNEALFGMASASTTAILRDGTGAVVGLEFPEEGVSGAASVQFRPGTAMAKIFTNGDDTRAALNRVPLRSYIGTLSANFRGIDQRQLNTNIINEMDRVSRNPWSNVAKAIAPVLEEAAAITFAVFSQEQIGLGTNILQGSGVIDVNDASKYLQTTRRAFEDLGKDRINLGEIYSDDSRAAPSLSENEIIVTTNYNSSFLTIDNVSVDQYEFRYSLPPRMMAELGERAGTFMMLGGASQTGYFAPASNSVIFTTAADAPLVKGRPVVPQEHARAGHRAAVRTGAQQARPVAFGGVVHQHPRDRQTRRPGKQDDPRRRGGHLQHPARFVAVRHEPAGARQRRGRPGIHAQRDSPLARECARVPDRTAWRGHRRRKAVRLDRYDGWQQRPPADPQPPSPGTRERPDAAPAVLLPVQAASSPAKKGVSSDPAANPGRPNGSGTSRWMDTRRTTRNSVGMTWMLRISAGVYALALLAACVATVGHRSDVEADSHTAEPPHSATTADPAPAPPPDEQHSADPLPDKIVGFAISLHHTEHLDLYLESIDEIADLGCNAVEIVTPAFQEHGASDKIELLTGPGRGPSREMLVKLLSHAHRRGLTTTLMPVVLFTNPRGNEWRGKISPEYWDNWWDSYHRMTDYFLDIANESHVDIYVVGSELLSTEKQIARWEAVIKRAREKFSGRLAYSTNWDHFHVPTLWKQLDVIGISGYWDLTTKADDADRPTDAELAERWADIRKKVIDFAREQQRQVIITEVGYPSLPWGIKDPWNYVNSEKVASDTAVQARGYASFLKAWDDLLAPTDDGVGGGDTALVRGVYFYEWSPYFRGGPHDTTYGVRGKPAHGLVRDWLAARNGAHD